MERIFLAVFLATCASLGQAQGKPYDTGRVAISLKIERQVSIAAGNSGTVALRLDTRSGDYQGSLPLCVRGAEAGNYSVSATSLHGHGGFSLARGQKALAYEARWNRQALPDNPLQARQRLAPRRAAPCSAGSNVSLEISSQGDSFPADAGDVASDVLTILLAQE